MVKTSEFIAQVYIKLNGQDLATSYMSELISVEVDSSLTLPTMFSLRFRDPELALLLSDQLKPGGEIQIRIASQDETDTLVYGELTSVEPDLSLDPVSTLTVRGYDRSHRMNRVRLTKSYQQITDSDLAQQLAGAAGLSAAVTATTEVYPYLLQTNQTNWEFLVERARRIGYRVWVENRTLYFKPPPPNPPVVTVGWREDLAEFRARLTTVEQVNEVTVRAYNPKTKQVIVGQASSGGDQVDIGITQTGGAAAQQAHGVQGKEVIVHHPVYSQGEANKLAQAMLDQINMGFIQAEGLCAGRPDLRAGNHLQTTGIGSRFSGRYLLTRALHRWNAYGYTTAFWVSGGRGGSTLTDLLRPAGSTLWAATPARPSTLGMVVGIVTNNVDPENMGRVRVKFPWLSDAEESWWCRVVMPMAGASRGFAYFPEVNDEVVCGFELGDPNHPYVLGAVWNGTDALPKPTDWFITGGKVIRRAVYSRVGHNFIIDDNDDTSGFVLADKTATNEIRINSDTHGTPNIIQAMAKKGLVLKDNTGNNQILINSDTHETPDTITITAQQDILVTATSGKIVIKAQGDIEVTATGKITVKSQSDISLDAMGNMNLHATGKISLAGDQGVSIESTAGKSVLKGTQGVDISSVAKTTVGGVTGVDIAADGGKLSMRGMAGAEMLASAGKAAITGTAGVDVLSPGITSIKGSILQLN
jgi:phage protein D